MRGRDLLTPLRTRGLARVRQHADLVMIARSVKHSCERGLFPWRRSPYSHSVRRPR